MSRLSQWVAPLLMTAVVPGGGALGQIGPAAAPQRINRNPPSPHHRPPVAIALDWGPVAALEVTRDDIPAKATRDAAQVARVRALLDEAAWTPASGPPRSRPDYWARLVPPDGEGGATVLIHGNVVYASVGGQMFSVETLTAASQLKLALWPLVSPVEAPILPQAVVDNLPGVEVRLAHSGHAPAVVLAGDQVRLEAPALDARGEPLEVHHILDATAAAATLRALGKCGLFARGKHFHAPAVAAPTTPAPGDSTQGPPPSAADGVSMSLTVRAGDWHRVWHEALGAAVLGHCVDTLARVPELKGALPALKALRSRTP